MIDKKRVGNYLKKLRKQKKKSNGKSFSQDDLANEFFTRYGKEISINAIAEWEGGNTLPSPENLEILSNIYNKSIDEILDGEEINIENFKEKYFIYDGLWGNNFDNEANLYQIRNEQIKLITSRFKTLLLTRINRHFSVNEEAEFRFLFDNFYYGIGKFFNRINHNSLAAKDEYLIFKEAINKLLVKNKNMTTAQKYWELQKLFSKRGAIHFTFMDDVRDLKNVDILKIRFKDLEDWEKDMLLAMFQTIESWNPNPAEFGAKSLKTHESQYGEYDHDKIIKDEIKELIMRGACLNKSFFGVKIRYTEKIRIIDRLEELYNLCLKPIEISVIQDDLSRKSYKIENNLKNRFLAGYYFLLLGSLKGMRKLNNLYSDIEEIYDWFINTDEISEETYLNIAKLERIDTNQEKKYWLAEVKSRSSIDKHFKKFKDTEKTISEGLKEIENLKQMLLEGKKEYTIYKEKYEGGNNEESIRKCIENWKSKMSYSDFLRSRDKKATENLLKEIDDLSLEEIKDKYFRTEVFDGE